VLALEFPGLLEFDDPAHEWRRLFSALFGPSCSCSSGPAVAISAARGRLDEPPSSAGSLRR
jgi:hypothetical protein